jgi:hypothetical protein
MIAAILTSDYTAGVVSLCLLLVALLVVAALVSLPAAFRAVLDLDAEHHQRVMEFRMREGRA